MVRVEDYLATLNATYIITPKDITILCSLASIGTVLGNLLVLVSITMFHKLRNQSNILIASLAVADLLVGALVMPISIIYDANQEWTFSQLLCTVWISFDVVCTTSSIFHIGCIAVDRYLTIMHPFRYPSFISIPKLCVIAVLTWVLSVGFVLLPINLGWNEPPKDTGPVMLTKQCFFITNGTYALITSMLIFYGPFLFMTLLYVRIFKVAMEQAIRTRRHVNRVGPMTMSMAGPSTLTVVTDDPPKCTVTASNEVKFTPNESDDQRKGVTNDAEMDRTVNMIPLANQKRQEHCIPSSDLISHTVITTLAVQPITRGTINHDTHTQTSKSPETPKEPVEERTYKSNSGSNYRAAKTLGLIMGCFFICWFPFFLIYAIHPSQPSFVETKALSKFSIWLGYLNSGMNPLIYARSARFRHAFKKIFRCQFDEFRE